MCIYLFSDNTNNKIVNFDQMKINSLKTNDNTTQNIYKQKQLDDKDIYQVLVFHDFKTIFNS